MTISPPDANAAPEDERDAPPTDVSVPVGDAIPAPVEPGLDQPLPEKGEAATEDDPAVEGLPESLGEVSKPLGDAIPTPVEPGTDQPLPEKNAGAGE
jgi:hypothetical protein